MSPEIWAAYGWLANRDWQATRWAAQDLWGHLLPEVRQVGSRARLRPSHALVAQLWRHLLARPWHLHNREARASVPLKLQQQT